MLPTMGGESRNRRPSPSPAPYVTDVIVLCWGEHAPSPNHQHVQHHLGTSKQMYVERDWNKPPVTNLVVFFPQFGEAPPPGFKQILNLSHSVTEGARIAVYQDEDGVCAVMDVCFSASGGPSWTLVDRTPLGFQANLASSVGTCSFSTATVVTLLGIKFDTRDLQRCSTTSSSTTAAVTTSDIVYAINEEEVKSHGSGSAHYRRKSSFLDLLLHPNPLASSSLSRRNSLYESSFSSTAESSSTTSAMRLNKQDSVTRLQRVRIKAGEDPIGNLLFDPEVAVQLLITEGQQDDGQVLLLERTTAAFLNICQGRTSEAMRGLDALLGLVHAQILVPSVPPSKQMSLFDFAIVYGAAGAMERGLDVLVGPACELVVQGAKLALQGLHVVTLHHSLAVLVKASEFQLQNRAPPTAALAPPPSAPTRLDSLKRLVLPSSVVAAAAVARLDQGAEAHEIPPASMIPAQMAMHSLFDLVIARCAALPRVNSPLDKVAAGEALEIIVSLVLNGGNGQRYKSLGLKLEISLQVYRQLELLVVGESDGAPLVDVLFVLIWLTCSQPNALGEFLKLTSQKLGDHCPYIKFVLRRLVFPVVMRRCMEDGVQRWPGVISKLWKYHRKSLRPEFAILFHTAITPAIKSGSGVEMLHMMHAWLRVSPVVLVELYENLNHAAFPDWKRFQDLMECICNLALSSPSPIALASTSSSSSACKLAKFAGHKCRATTIPSTANRKLSFDPMEEEDDEDKSPCLYAMDILVCISRHLVNLCGTVQLNKLEWKPTTPTKGKEMEHQHLQTVAKALELGKGPGGAKSAVDFLVAAGHLDNLPLAVCRFLRTFQTELGEASVGDFLGEGGKTSEDEVFMTNLRNVFVKNATVRSATDSLDQALRRFLTQSGFRLPGEAQKIERLLDAFAKRFALDHEQDLELSAESVLLLAFALVMLNTDLHKPQIKRNQKMKREDFVRNLRGGNHGKDFPQPFLEQMYESIRLEPIRLMMEEDVASSASLAAGASSSASSSPTATVGEGNGLLQKGVAMLSAIQDKDIEFNSGVRSESPSEIFRLLSSQLFLICNHWLIEDNQASLNSELYFKSLQLVKYSIVATLFLDASSIAPERRALAVLLNKLKPNEALFVRLIEYEFGELTVGEMVTAVHEWVTCEQDQRQCWRQDQHLQQLAVRLNYPALANSCQRRLVREGEVHLGSQPQTLLLFTDSLILFNPQVGEVEQDLPLRTLRVGVLGEDEDDDKFEVCSPMMCFPVRAKSRADRDTWLASISQTCLALVSGPVPPVAPTDPPAPKPKRWFKRLRRGPATKPKPRSKLLFGCGMYIPV
ncbi:hypothetical protein BASA81_003657 [Batrachochytrium salamandrivorans]|nr:hypothetical protein BASA81_003657 [Batrachochytrium salamandrivorans]